MPIEAVSSNSTFLGMTKEQRVKAVQYGTIACMVCLTLVSLGLAIHMAVNGMQQAGVYAAEGVTVIQSGSATSSAFLSIEVALGGSICLLTVFLAQRRAQAAQTTAAPSLLAQIQNETVTSPFSGVCQSISVKVGDQVAAGETICVLEAMKVQMRIAPVVQSSVTAQVKAVHVQPGQKIVQGQPLVTLAPVT